MRLIPSIVALAVSAFPALAQSDAVSQRVRAGQGNTIQVQLSMSIEYDRSGDPEAQQQDALKRFYRLAGKSCELALESVARECEIVNISANTRVDQQRGAQLTVGGQVLMKVEFQPAASAPPR